MRLLFLSLTLPLPANNGYKIRTWALLRALAAEGHEVSLLTFERPGEVLEPDEKLVRGICRDVERVPLAWTSLSSKADLIGRLRGLPRAHPYSVERFTSDTMRTRILSRLGERNFDAIVSDSFGAVNVPDASPPILLDNQNVEHMILRRYLHRERNPMKLAYAWHEYWRMKRWEREVCTRSAVGMVCSAVDRHAFETLCSNLPIVVVPNVVDLDVGETDAAEEPHTILFQGGMDWYPNRDAVEFFASTILPEVRRQIPDVRFIVAGRNPTPAFIKRFADVPGMSFTGTVDNIRTFIARASICVVPLRIGSGTRLKILEAAAMAKPVVSTTVGAEGLDFVADEEIILADRPQAFARVVARLLRDEARRFSLGRAARCRVAKDYSFPVLQAAIRQALVAAAAQ